MPADQKEKILFMSLPLGKGNLSGMDIPPGMPPVEAGSNFTISLDTDSEEEVTRVFNGLSKGGQVRFPLGPQFWATYFGMLTDQYGVTWMLSYNK
jgi:PhnB protein